ncbi:hypothetical protein LUX01_13720 [Streptomyces sudanensis]|uniref:hypothetical protein n=1 Tax=Streptomyces sudanensis TaxID=436397 RepID=UPI0020CEACA2|nr:hypothetical protein [Streptomyces sudanensis]MCP9987589.1 hypothetical protein [Streptomyces sudanensis]
MSATTLPPTAGGTPGPRTPQAPGAEAPHGAGWSASPLGGALRAVRVFAAAAFGVAVLGDYDADAAGVRRR